MTKFIKVTQLDCHKFEKSIDQGGTGYSVKIISEICVHINLDHVVYAQVNYPTVFLLLISGEKIKIKAYRNEDFPSCVIQSCPTLQN